MRYAGFRHRGVILLLIIIYRMILDYCYETGIAVYYGHRGFVYSHSLKWTFISWVILIGLSFVAMPVLMNNGKRISSLVVSVLFVLVFVPFTTIVREDHQSNGFVAGCTLYWGLLFFFQHFFSCFKINGIPKVTAGRQISGDRIAKWTGIAGLLVVIYISGRYTHFRLLTNIINVYGIRSESKTYAISSIVRYLFAFTKAVCPFMILYSYIRRKWGYVFLFLFVQLLSFGIDGVKMTFFTPLMLLFFCFLAERLKQWKATEIVLASFGTLSVLSVMEQAVTGTFYITAFFLYRVVFCVLKLNTYYFDFFTTHQPDYFASTFLRHFGIRSVYSGMDIANMISGIYTGDYNVVANNGLVSDAVANLGIPGLVIMPFVLAVFFHIFDICAWGLDRRILLPLSIQVSISLSNTQLSTSLLTSGFLMIMFLMVLIRRDHFGEEAVYRKGRLYFKGVSGVHFSVRR